MNSRRGGKWILSVREEFKRHLAFTPQSYPLFAISTNLFADAAQSCRTCLKRQVPIYWHLAFRDNMWRRGGKMLQVFNF